MPVPPEHDPGIGSRLLSTDVVPCSAGVLGQPGESLDTLWMGYQIILPDGEGATLVVTGIDREPRLFDQKITRDGAFWFPFGIVNKHGPLTFRASMAGVIWVSTRPSVQVPV